MRNHRRCGPAAGLFSVTHCERASAHQVRVGAGGELQIMSTVRFGAAVTGRRERDTLTRPAGHGHRATDKDQGR